MRLHACRAMISEKGRYETTCVVDRCIGRSCFCLRRAGCRRGRNPGHVSVPKPGDRERSMARRRRCWQQRTARHIPYAGKVSCKEPMRVRSIVKSEANQIRCRAVPIEGRRCRWLGTPGLLHSLRQRLVRRLIKTIRTIASMKRGYAAAWSGSAIFWNSASSSGYCCAR